MSNWPTQPDGRPMRLGEMTPAQKREQTKLAVQRVAAEFRRNAPAIARVLADFDREHAAPVAPQLQENINV